ncbi:MAG TPA: SMP-30/gluconolactonase/LRE family protein [Planctomycetota bacterium]|nr:SMP-30/gluconolactonase/LRE family protein [Planctomycetota bacterium]
MSTTPQRAHSLRSRVVLGCAVVALLVGGWLLCWPIPYEPLGWTPEPAPTLSGPFAANDRLTAITSITGPIGTGPEDLAFAADGTFCTGLADGRILHFAADGSALGEFTRTGGRLLGLIFDAQGNLLVADAERGLLSIATDGITTCFASSHNELLFACTNEVDLAQDGTVYFTVSSHLPVSQHIAAVIEHREDGRLLAWDPVQRRTRLLCSNLAWANGVAVAEDGASLLVVETSAYRVRRFWLSGPRRGQDEIVAANLPGFPDGINRDGHGGYWLAIPAPRDALLDVVHPHPWLKRIILRLPAWMQPAPQRYSLIVHLDRDGHPDQSLHDPAGGFAPITNVVPHAGKLYLGSYQYDRIGCLPAP